MGAPNFFGSIAAFMPCHSFNPSDDGDSFAFCQTRYDSAGEQTYLKYKRIDCKDRQQLTDLYYAVVWALGTFEDRVCHPLARQYTRNCPSAPTTPLNLDVVFGHLEEAMKQ